MLREALIVATGIDNQETFSNFVVRQLAAPGRDVVIFNPNWAQETTLASQQERLETEIETFASMDYLIGFVGVSAGGTLAALSLPDQRVNAVATVCSPLRYPKSPFPSMEELFSDYPSFAQAAWEFEHYVEPSLDDAHRSKLLTLMPEEGGDEVISTATMSLVGGAIHLLRTKAHMKIILSAFRKTDPLEFFFKKQFSL